MEKKAFEAESKRLMELMINSIYTHKEIFLREIISNASDAIDKLAYRALTDESVGLSRDDFQIVLSADKEAGRIQISDNGIGMTAAAMEENLGTIARSGSHAFKEEMEEAEEIDIIGQFGVGFYSAFMVAERVEVVSRAYGETAAHRWVSEGIDGYTIEACEKDTTGTDIYLYLKKDADEEEYSAYLETRKLQELVRKYSDYIRYPIRMELPQQEEKPAPDPLPEDYKPEFLTVMKWETVNSMVPLWQRSKSAVTEEEYHSFYREKFADWEAPLLTSHIAAEGNLEYKALLYIPAHTPMDYYSKEFKRGLQLYSSGVLIMEHCEALLPEYFGFVRGVVDSPDVSLNISRELLQQDRQVKVIANNLEKKLRGELAKLLANERERYETFFASFGSGLKYSLMNQYGANREQVQDLILFYSSKENKLTTLKEYTERMPESQSSIYFAVAQTVEKAEKLPQAERILKAGYEVLYLISEEDELLLQILGQYAEKNFVSVSSEEALPMTETEKSDLEAAEEKHRELLDFVKERLGEAVTAVRLSKILQSGAVCLSSDGPVSIEMEQYFQKMNSPFPMQAGRVLELNADSEAFEALQRAYDNDKERAAEYAELLLSQAILIAGLPLPDPVRHSELICKLFARGEAF